MKVEALLFHKNNGFGKENDGEIIGTCEIIFTWYLTKPAQNVTFNLQFQIQCCSDIIQLFIDGVC